jgi:phage gpG-like protein
MIRAEWDISAALRGLRALADAVRDLRPLWPSVLVYLRKATQQTFATQGGRIGESWPELSTGYAKQKARVWPGQPILRASDAMFNSLVSQTGDSVAEMNRDSFAFGTRDRKAKYHQRGGGRATRRAMLAVTEEDRRGIRGLMVLHLGNQLRLNGFGG